MATIDTSIDVIKLHPWGVSISNHFGDGILIGGERYTDAEFWYTGVAAAVGKVIGITHLFYEQSNVIEE